MVETDTALGNPSRCWGAFRFRLRWPVEAATSTVAASVLAR